MYPQNVSLNLIVGFNLFLLKWWKLNQLQQQDTYILAILGGHKHCFKVKSSALILQEHFALFVIKDYEYPFF